MAEIAEKWEQAFGHSREHVREYHLNHAFLEGYQWMQWNPVELQVQGLPEDTDRIQAVMNRMRSNTRTVVAKLMQRPLLFQVLPSGYDDVSLRGARLGEGLLADYRKNHNWEVLREGHIKATIKGGTGIIAVEYSPDNQTTVETVLGVPEFVVEPGARDAETARWWIKLQLLPPEEVQAMFPGHFPDEPPQADGKLGMASEYEYRDRRTPRTRVYTYYERPNPLCPEGKFVVEVGGTKIETGDWPFPFTDRLNIAVARESLIEHEAFGTTIWSDARSPQAALNAAWSGFLENMREAANNRLLVDHSWEDQLDVINDRAGQALLGDMTRPTPAYLEAPQTPRALIQGIEMLQGELDTLLSSQDVSRGDAPANIESGLGIQLLIEQNDTPVGRLIGEVARCWSTVGSMVLQILEAEITTKKTTTVRDGQGPSRREWTGKVLHGQTDATVSEDSIAPKSRAAQQAIAQSAMQMGMLGDPTDPMTAIKFIKFSDMPDARGLIAVTNRDADRAIRENESIVMGEMPAPADYDDHAIHRAMHLDFQKTLEYELLSGEQKEVFRLHMQGHDTMAAEALSETRVAQQIDPALGELAPGPTPEPVLPPDVAAPSVPPAPEEPISPDQATADMLKAIEGL